MPALSWPGLVDGAQKTEYIVSERCHSSSELQAVGPESKKEEMKKGPQSHLT